jgi:hypothetical protein
LIINLNLTDIITGYDVISEYERTFRQRWIQPLLENYAQRRTFYEIELKVYQRSLRRRKMIFLSGTMLLLVLVATGSILLAHALANPDSGQQLSGLICLAPIFCVGGVGIAIMMGATFLFLPSPKRPDPPVHPLKDKNKVITPPLTDRWWVGMAAPAAPTQPDEGYAGEVLLIKKLEEISFNQLILHRLVQKDGDDLDVVVIGERGIWLFEVKYWKGSILHEDGEWQQMKTFRGPGGRAKMNRRIIENHPDQQWQRMKDELLLTLRKHLNSSFIKSSEVVIHGGVLFAHPKSKITIPKGSGFSWGNLSFWLNQYTNTPADPVFQDDRNKLLVAEVLIKRHQQVVSESPLKSMKELADRLIIQADEEINTYCHIAN